MEAVSSRKQPPQSRFVRRAFPMAMVLFGGCAASSTGDRTPVPALANSTEVKREFDELVLRWDAAGAGRERLELDSRLRSFVRRYREAPVARRVRVYLAWNCIARNELAGAERWLVPVLDGPRGAARDEGIVVAAAIALKRGEARRALELLQPLDGKIVDDTTYSSFSEQRALAALATRNWSLAVDTIKEWLASVPPPLRPASEPRARIILEQLPIAELGHQLERLNAKSGRVAPTDPAAEAARWLYDSLRQRLVSSALARRDAKLAQRLVRDGAAWQDHAEDVALVELADKAEVDPVVGGRVVGLVVYTGDSRRRRVSAAVSEGLVLALGLPRRGETPDAPRLLIREVEDSGSVLQTLSALAGEGAAVLIAGVDAESADQALKYVGPNATPLLLLGMPNAALPAGTPVFSLGLTLGAEERATTEVLSRLGTEQVAFVGLNGECESQYGQGAKRFPTDEWKRNAVDALAVLGPTDCAKSLTRQLLRSAFHPTLVFGLESASAYGTDTGLRRSIWLSTGYFPLSAHSELPAAIANVQRSLGWYQSLGYDAGTIAIAALRAVPMDRVEDDGEVAAIHRATTAMLSESEFTLITTLAHGFNDARTLDREIEPIVGGH